MIEEKPVMFLDTETNGLPKDYKKAPDASDNWPRIVQMAWIMQHDANSGILERDFIIQPDGWEVTPESTKIHGITPLMASANGVPLRRALELFIEDLDRVQLVVAHNVKFDRSVIASEMMRLGLKPKRLGYQFYCTMEHGTDVVKIPGMYGNKWPTLTELHRYFFNSGFEEAHNALADVKACAAAYWKLRVAETL